MLQSLVAGTMLFVPFRGTSWLGLLSLCLLAASAHAKTGRVDVAQIERCRALESVDFSDLQDAPTQITRAQWIAPAKRERAYCLVEGYVTPQVGFELRLPDPDWNGKLLVLGNGGWGGDFDADACVGHLAKGYACLVSDTGHKGSGPDGLWAFHNLQAQVDFAYRSVHVATLAAKSIVGRYYTQAPRRSYFMGCSTGGYEGLVEAQRFPWDFDGIIAGSPDMDEADLIMRNVWNVRSFTSTSGEPILNAHDIDVLHRAVLAACDSDDGVQDGIVSDPVDCKFDPANLLCSSAEHYDCLTPAQVAAVKRIYAGPSNSVGEPVSTPGILPGSELLWGDKFDGLNGQDIRDEAESFLRYMIYGASPDWKVNTFNFDRDYKRIGLGALYNDTNPDLRKFKAAGGKLLVYQGGNDLLEVPGAILDYYSTTERTMGGRTATQDFFRLFMIPAMYHCTGGPGPYAVDYLSYLEKWVEASRPPDVMIGAHLSDAYMAAQPLRPKWDTPGLPLETRAWIAAVDLRFPLDPAIPVVFTRPIFPYPRYARYTGSGDHNVAANFLPVDPEADSRGRLALTQTDTPRH